MTGLSSFDFYFRSTIFPFLFLMSSRPSSVLLFICLSVALFLRFSVLPLFLVFHVPSSLPFHVFCFPLPTFRCLVSQLFLSSFSSIFFRDSILPFNLLILIRPYKSDGKQMPTSKRYGVVTRTKYFYYGVVGQVHCFTRRSLREQLVLSSFTQICLFV